MEWKILPLIALLLGVICNVIAGDDSSSEDGDRKHHKGNPKKIIMMSVFGALIVATIVAVVVICICKKKTVKRTTPSPDCHVTIIEKQGMPQDYTSSPNGLYNAPPTYEGFAKIPGQQQSLGRPFASPPPSYSYDQ